jgi:anti-anti-sigma regulatory factor
MHFSLTRRQRDDRVVTLTPAGEADLRTAGALRAAIQDTLRTPHPVDVVVDLGR